VVLIPLAIVGALFLLAWAMYPALKVQYETGRRLAGLQAEYKDLSARNKALRAEVAGLKTPEGVEKAARENLGLARPGENVYVVMPANETSMPAGSADATSTAARGGKDVVTALLDAVFGVR
jgi:cell division protein FtsL